MNLVSSSQLKLTTDDFKLIDRRYDRLAAEGAWNKASFLEFFNNVSSSAKPQEKPCYLPIPAARQAVPIRSPDMALEFLNDARSYDAARQCVSFWGHDSAFEVTFRLDFTALKRFAGLDTLNEATALKGFDQNIEHVRAVARKLYQRNPKRYWELSLADM